VWLLSIAVTIGALGLFTLGLRPWRKPGHGDLGAMSQQWLAEHRAGSR
jgi:hypothetical protein